jgi:hypothetical protein
MKTSIGIFAFFTVVDAFVVPTQSRAHNLLPTTRKVHLPNRKLSLSPQQVIEAGVSFDTFAPQFLWLPMIVAPTSNLTKKVMGGSNGIAAIVTLALVHLAIIVTTAATQEGTWSQLLIFTEVFDPSLSQLEGMQKLFVYPNFVAEEWSHVLIWDLFVGRAIWLEGLKRGIDTRVSLTFCNFIGPPGLLIFVATCLLSGKGFPSMSVLEDSSEIDETSR